MKNNLFKKFLSFSYGSVIGLFIGILTTVIQTRLLTPDEFGKASMFLLALNVFMILVVFGTDQTFVRFFYEEDLKKRGGLLYNSIKIPLFIAVLLGLILLLNYKTLSLFLFGEEMFIVIFMLVVGIITQSLMRFSILVIRMQQKGNLFSIIEILKRAFQLVFLVLIYFIIGEQFEIIVYSTIITFLMLSVFAILKEKKYWSIANLKVKKLKHSNLDILKYSYPLMFTTLITWLFQSFDRIALRQWSDFEELGFYAAAFKIVALLTVVQTAFSTFWSPVVYEKFENDPGDKKFFSKTSNIIAFSMFLIAILTIMLKDIAIMLLGSQFTEASLILPFLVFMPLMYTISETTVIGINFYKKPNWHIFIATVSCMVNILGNWLLVPLYGGLGAAVSTAFSYIIFFSLRTMISLRYFEVKYELGKLYTMVIIIIIYSLISININSVAINLIVGTLAFIVTLIIYFKELKFILAFIKIKRNS